MKSVAPCFCNRTCNKRTHLDFLSRIQINQTMKINLIVQIITAVISITVSFASNKFRCKLPITKRTIVQHYAPLQPSVFQDFMLPMRDGIKLHTVALSPLFSSKKQWPTVIDRSPYGQFNTELLADLYLLFDFAAVSQDMRGCCQSEGNFTVWHADENDGVDTINWIVAQPWSNGVVYQIGASADGIAGFEIARAASSSDVTNSKAVEALAGQFIIFATAEARRTFFPGGTYRQNLIEKWLHGTVPTQATAIINTVKTKEAPSSWWDAVEIKGDQFNSIDWPTVMWAGWYDIFLHGHLYSYDGFQKRSQSKGKHWLVVDPLGHCQAGAKYFPHNLIEGRSLLPVLLGIQMFQNNLTSSHDITEHVKQVTFYVMSNPKNTISGNYWTSLDDFPKKKITLWYLHGDGSSTDGLLSPLAPTDVSASSDYLYDPENPTPSNGGNNLLMSCGPLDQSQIENRSDVIVFTSDVLTKPLAITGELDVDLYVSAANVNDTDFSIRLTSVDR